MNSQKAKKLLLLRPLPGTNGGQTETPTKFASAQGANQQASGC